MADQNPITGYFDLNLGPLDNSGGDGELGLGIYPDVSMNLEDWLDAPAHRVREVFEQRSQQWRSFLRQDPTSLETRNLALGLTRVDSGGDGILGNEVSGKKEGAEKSNGDERSFFDCNICLDLGKDPVVTCCGHLFCWPCLYQWLSHHSDPKECPVCKGEATMENITPICRRDTTTTTNIREASLDSSIKVPIRPQARRVESWRQTIQRTAFTVPMGQMIRRLGGTFEQFRNNEDSQIPPEGNSSFLNRILTSRGMRAQRTPAPALPSDEVNEDFTLSTCPPLIGLDSSLDAETVVESYFNDNPLDMNGDIPLPDGDNMYYMSSIAAVINSESQALGNASELDLTVSRSTSSSRRRSKPSRTSGASGRDTRASRRRRLQ